MPSMINLHVAIIIGFCTQMMMAADCPRLCECKWKSGKETVLCLNANLSSVPIHLEAGTQVLDLTGNNLATVKHDEFSKAGLLNLQKVYIAKCRLKNLERYAFRNLINLVELDLTYNVLASVPSHTFDSVPELRELKLSGNPIQRIVNDAFVNLPQLVRLELSDCRIGTIEPRAFFGLERSLEWLKLDNNKLIEVKSSSFTTLRNLHGLELAGNPWNCSCALRPLREWMLRENVPFGVPPVCQYPKRLSAKPWDKLDLDEFACIPEIFAYESKTHGVEGKNITMTCRIAGIPEPSVRWLLKNKVIANLSGSSYTNGKKLYMVHLQNNSSDLTIFSADLQDAGVYVCAAENKAGKAEASVTLAVTKKPPESTLYNKILLACTITGVALFLVSCFIVVCVYSVRKKEMARWRNRECYNREDNYEKIELNHHKMTGGTPNGGVAQAEIALVAPNKKNGDYRVVPAADTDHEVEEEEEQQVANNTNGENSTTVKSPKTWKGETVVEKRWNSPEHLLDPEDLHIPRRTLQEARDDIKKTLNSTSGTFNSGCHGQHRPSTSSSQTSTPYVRRSSLGAGDTISSYATTFNTELSNLAEEEQATTVTGGNGKKFPDLIENSSSYRFSSGGGKASSEGGSVSDITELFCTLPRKRATVQSSRYRSSDSQSPLLPESRYGSSNSGGECCTSYDGSQECNAIRRLSSDSSCQKYPFTTGLNSNRTNNNNTRASRMSNSYLNLSARGAGAEEETSASATPLLLNVSNLESRMSSATMSKGAAFPTSSGTPNANAYDYHAAQLEKFLEEYRTLQKELTRMKQTCDTLRQEKGPHLKTTSAVVVTKTESDSVLPSSDFSSSTDNAVNSVISPNSNHSLEDSVDFRNFESELTKYLLSKTSSSPKPFSGHSGVFNN